MTMDVQSNVVLRSQKSPTKFKKKSKLPPNKAEKPSSIVDSKNPFNTRRKSKAKDEITDSSASTSKTASPKWKSSAKDLQGGKKKFKKPTFNAKLNNDKKKKSNHKIQDNEENFDNSLSTSTSSNFELKSSIKSTLKRKNVDGKEEPTKKKVKFSIENDIEDEEQPNPQENQTTKKKKKRKKKKPQKRPQPNNDDEGSENESFQEGISRKEKATVYLELWKTDKQNWKFEKITQVWLLKNMFDEAKVPEKSFQILLEYLVDLKGIARNSVVKQCEEIIKNNKKSTDASAQLLYNRARSVLQYVQ